MNFFPPSPLPPSQREGEPKVILCKWLRPLHPRHQTACGTYSPCRSGTRRAACPSGRRVNLPHHESLAPIPPTPLPRRGRGSPKVYFAGGFAPGTPALNRLRHLQTLPYRCPAGSLPGRSPGRPALSFICCPHPPHPRSQSALPGGKGGVPKFISPGAEPPAPLH